nr:hypothetical protein [Tanacetum cinerariifolium]
MELEVDEDFTQESQKKKQELEEAQKRETTRLPEMGLLWYSRYFISKIGGLRRRKEAVHELGYKIVPSCDRSRRFFFNLSPGYSLKRK